MITIYGKESVLLENGEHKPLSVIHIGNEIIFVKDEDIKKAVGKDDKNKSQIKEY